MMKKLIGALILVIFYPLAGSEIPKAWLYSNSEYLSGYGMNEIGLWQWAANDPAEFNALPLPFTTNIFQNMIVLYEEKNKGANSSHCQFNPSCSRYSYMSFEKFGTIPAVVMTIGRLSRCNSSAASKHFPYSGGFKYDFPYELAYNYDGSGSASAANQQNNRLAWLLERKEYRLAYESLVELEYESPDLNKRIMLAKLSLNSGENIKAEKWLEKDNCAEAVFLKSLSEYRQGYFTEVRKNLTPFSDSAGGNFGILWLHSYIESPSPLELKALEYNINSFVPAPDRLTVLNGINEYVRNGPSGTALSLIQSALIPGLGQSTNGFLEDGITAFIFTAGFGYLTYRNIVNEDYVDAAAFGIGFAFSYASNLISAYNSPVQKWKQEIYKLHMILNKRFDPYKRFEF